MVERQTENTGIARRPARCGHLEKKKPFAWKGSDSVAEWTGLEPATPGVTGRYSNQLNYHSAVKPAK